MKKIIYLLIGVILVCLMVNAIKNMDKKNDTIQTSSGAVLDTKKVEWGIKRNDNHEQPDLGSKNKTLIDANGDIAMGNKEDKYVYLTFDQGYEAGYTSKILDVLKENNVPAIFFITGHYLNSAPELVKRMIDEGHIVGNHFPNSYMYLKIKAR